MDIILCGKEELFSPKSDLVFKALFGREEGKPSLHSLLNSMLNLNIHAPEDITFTNTEINEPYPGDKNSRFDVSVLTTDNVHVDVEIQLFNKEDMMKRSVYYVSKFINAKSEEELAMLSDTNVQIRTAVERLHVISADNALRYEYEMREKSRRDHNAEISFARHEGREQGREQGREERTVDIARNLKSIGVDVSSVSKATGLSEAEIDNL